MPLIGVKVDTVATKQSTIQADVQAWLATHTVTVVYNISVLLTGFVGEWQLLVVIFYF